MQGGLAVRAELVARHAHQHQVDKRGAPYVHHLKAVADSVAGDDAKATGWLHDIIEDTPIGPQDLRNMAFPDYIIEAVLLLTHTHESTRVEYLTRIRDTDGYAGDLARTVKAADIRHNMSDERKIPGSEGERMRKRYLSDLELLEGS